MHKQIEYYKARGYCEIATDSGTGSTILISDELKRAVKFNFDPAYDKFVALIRLHASEAFPKIYRHVAKVNQSGALTRLPYTITEMELLRPLSEAEQSAVVNWIQGIYTARRSGVPLEQIKDDPFGLLRAVASLMSFAAASGVINLDLAKGTNYMIRSDGGSCVFVVTDPFN